MYKDTQFLNILDIRRRYLTTATASEVVPVRPSVARTRSVPDPRPAV